METLVKSTFDLLASIAHRNGTVCASMKGHVQFLQTQLSYDFGVDTFLTKLLGNKKLLHLVDEAMVIGFTEDLKVPTATESDDDNYKRIQVNSLATHSDESLSCLLPLCHPCLHLTHRGELPFAVPV